MDEKQRPKENGTETQREREAEGGPRTLVVMETKTEPNQCLCSSSLQAQPGPALTASVITSLFSLPVPVSPRADRPQ